MNVYERREQISRLIISKPLNTNQIAEALGIDPGHVRHDLRNLSRRAIVKACGWEEGMRTFKANRIVLAKELRSRIGNEKNDISKKFDASNLPQALRLMFGYTDVNPTGGRFIDNSDFMPSPVRTAPIKVYPGTSWGDVALRMP
jgi:hypothetical protein